MKAAIYGAGSLGTILGAYITKGGDEIDLITRNRAHVDALNRNGASIVGSADFTVPVKALTPDKIDGKYELIFLTTKQLHNVTVLRGLKPFLSPNCLVCTLQNGLPEQSVASVMGKDNVAGCAVSWTASYVSPGTVKLTSEAGSSRFILCIPDGSTDERLLEVKRLLEHMCMVETVSDIEGLRWSRLLIYAAFSGLSSALNLSYGEILDMRAARHAAMEIVREVMAVAHAAGIKFAPIEGTDVEKAVNFTNAIMRDRTEKIFAREMRYHRLPKASMLSDLLAHKPCEIEAFNGIVCDYGRRYGVKTPFNDAVVSTVYGIEHGRLKPSLDNLPIFTKLGR